MTNEEIQKHIEQNCRNEHGEPMMDEQTFYEGAKWMRDQALRIHDVVGRSEQLKALEELKEFAYDSCQPHNSDRLAEIMERL